MRTSGVKLVADVSDYKRGVREAAGETDKLSASIAAAGKSSKSTGAAADDLGGDLRDTARDARALKSEIEKVERSLAGLATEFAATSNASDRLDLTKAIRKQQGELRQLLKVQKLLPTPAEVEPAGNRLGAKLGAAIGKGLEAAPMSPPMLAALGGAALSAAPLIGAAVAGGIIGGVGIGGVVGGLTLAAKDPRVQAAAQSLGARLGSRLEHAAGSFVGPAIDGLHEIERAADSIDFEAIFGKSAQFVLPLVNAVSSAITDIGDALEALVANAGGPIQAISDGIAGIGKAAGQGLKSLADNGEAGADALRTLFGVISSSVTVTFQLINALTELYAIGQKIGADAGLQLLLKATGGAMDANAFSARRTAGAVGDMGGAMAAAGRDAVAAASSLDGMAEASERLADVNLSAAEAALRLKEATRLAGKAADDHKAVSAEEQSALLAMARATNTSTTALDKQGRSVGSATRAHEANRQKLIETARQMGYTKTQAEKLADQYLAVPKNVNTKVTQPGMSTSQKETREYDKQLDNLARQIKTHVSVEGDAAAYAKLRRLLVAQQAATKGISISAASSAFNKNAKGFSGGGRTGGAGEHEPAGVVHGQEFVVNAKTVRAIDRQSPGFLDEVQATGQLPGYEAGGRVLPMPFPVNASQTKVMSMAEALAAVGGVAGQFGQWPSSPGAQRGDSGVWRRIVALVRASGIPYDFGNAYRPGDPLWHGSGRAVDFMGYNQDRLASFFQARQSSVLELIHRTNRRDYGITRGHYNAMPHQWPLHRNHLHVAMDDGGMRVLQPGVNVIANGTGRPEPIAGPTAMAAMAGNTTMVTVNPTIHINGSNLSAQQIAAEVDRQIGAQFNQIVRGITG